MYMTDREAACFYQDHYRIQQPLCMELHLCPLLRRYSGAQSSDARAVHHGSDRFDMCLLNRDQAERILDWNADLTGTGVHSAFQGVECRTPTTFQLEGASAICV
jgi:hypothetical protein